MGRAAMEEGAGSVWWVALGAAAILAIDSVVVYRVARAVGRRASPGRMNKLAERALLLSIPATWIAVAFLLWWFYPG